MIVGPSNPTARICCAMRRSRTYNQPTAYLSNKACSARPRRHAGGKGAHAGYDGWGPYAGRAHTVAWLGAIDSTWC